MRTLISLAILSLVVGCATGGLTPAGSVTASSQPVNGANPPGGPGAGAKPLESPRATPSEAAGTNPTAPAGSPPIQPSAVPSGCDADFDTFNVDKDTTLSYDEYANGRWSQVRFIKAPTAEEEAAMKAGFRGDAQKADTNQDNTLSREEFRKTCS